MNLQGVSYSGALYLSIDSFVSPVPLSVGTVPILRYLVGILEIIQESYCCHLQYYYYYVGTIYSIVHVFIRWLYNSA
jgi:hypothetical protein